MPAIYAEVGGDRDRLLERLKRLGHLQLSRVNGEIAEQLRSSTVQRFQQEKDPEGRPWTASIRAREEGGKTLTQTARLKTSILAASDRTGLAVGTNTIYAAAHQFGDERIVKPKKAKVLRFRVGGRWVSAKQVRLRIPARPFLGISEEDREFIRDTVDNALKE